MKGTVLDTVLREFGGSLSHLWILLRLSSPGWYYGEYHYPGRELTQWQIFRQNEYPGTMISVFRSVCQPASLDRIRWIYLRNVIFTYTNLDLIANLCSKHLHHIISRDHFMSFQLSNREALGHEWRNHRDQHGYRHRS